METAALVVAVAKQEGCPGAGRIVHAFPAGRPGGRAHSSSSSSNAGTSQLNRA